MVDFLSFTGSLSETKKTSHRILHGSKSIMSKKELALSLLWEYCQPTQGQVHVAFEECSDKVLV